MLETIVKNQIIFYVMGIVLGLGVVAKFISVFTIRRMVKAASQIQKSNHKLMRLINAKFEHASMVSDRVQNVEAFVDKYIYEYKVFGISLNSFRAFPKKALWITGILGVFAIFESYRMEGMGELLFGYVQWTGIFVMLLLLLCFVTEENVRITAARNYMVEYLENVCAHRYAKANAAGVHEENADALEKTAGDGVKSEEVQEESVDAAVKLVEAAGETGDTIAQVAEKVGEESRKREQEMRIRAILEEFLA